MLRPLMKRMYLRCWVLPRMHRAYQPLSITETFQRVYSSKIWGDSPGGFCSGPGSDGPASDDYCNSVISFIRAHRIESVIDLGCGDFSIGRRIVDATGILYTGVDVVPELIAHHKGRIQSSTINFLCADITRDSLPLADLCLVRQVLQHLSNEEIEKVLANLCNFATILVSEDVPLHPKSFNHDKPHGPDIRASYDSGVYLDRPPFSRMATELWSFGLRPGAVLRTVVLRQRQDH